VESFFSSLESRIKTIDSLLCVGLDPREDDVVEHNAESVREFCFRIIDQTADLAAAYKPNSAFFEVLGIEGTAVLQDVISHIPSEIPVILDVKRGDIASTAEAYARTAFEILKADAVTLNPYLGKDAVQPFIEYPGKGAFILCKTSNPGAGDFQDVLVSPQDLPLHLKVASMVKEWNNGGNLGLVVGATQVESLNKVRRMDPQIWILAPGIGAQGGNLQAALQAGLREDGSGLLIPVSRAISKAEDPRHEAERIKVEINKLRQKVISGGRRTSEPSLTELQQELASGLLKNGCIQFGEFTLKSGDVSPIYIDLRRIIAHPDFLIQVAKAFQEIIEPLQFDHLAALPYAALPITSAISLLGGWSMVYPRKEEKTYGTKALVEGVFSEGDTAVVVDDLITTGGSKLEGINKLRENGLNVKDIVVLIDRGIDSVENLKKEGYRLHTFLSIQELLSFYQKNNLVDRELLEKTKRYLEG
jgi:uridine monophosphate synthetase